MLLEVEGTVGEGKNRHGRRQRPNPALKSLEVMVGTWELKGRGSGHAPGANE